MGSLKGSICFEEHCVECGLAESTAGCDDAGKPICNDNHECVVCLDDAQCENGADSCVTDTDSTKNVCLDCSNDSHCKETSTAPICDTAAHMCGPCTEFEGQCSNAGACHVWGDDEDVGTCMNDVVLYVGDGSNLNEGTLDKPLKTIAHALSLVEEGGFATIYVLQPYDTDESLEIDGGKHVAIIGYDGDDAVLSSTTGPAMIVRDESTAYFQDVIFNGAMGDMVQCVSSSIHFDRVSIDNGETSNVGSGITANNCEIFADRLFVARNKVYGLDLSNGTTTLQNTIIGRNGNADEKEAGGIKLAIDANLSLNYVTVAENRNDEQQGKNLACSSNGVDVRIRNSLIVGSSALSLDDVCKTKAAFEQSAIDDLDFPMASGYKVYTSGELAEVLTTLDDADWTIGEMPAGLEELQGIVVTRDATDPAHDFEGNERPLAGMPDFVGADRPN